MSSSKKTEGEEIFAPDQPVQIKKNPPLPQPGYGLIIREDLAQLISEFVDSPLFKKLERAYKLQALDRIGRMCLQSAQNVEWLMYYKGGAAYTKMFFDDMKQIKKSFIAKNSDSDPDAKKFKS